MCRFTQFIERIARLLVVPTITNPENTRLRSTEMQCQLVVFDMAGTTVQDDDVVNASFRDAIDAAGIKADRDTINAYMGIAKPVAILSILKETGATGDLEAQVDQIHNDFVQRMINHYQTSDDVVEVEGTTETFKALREAGVKVALDTGFSRPIAQVIIDRLGWEKDGLIDCSVTSDEVEHGRPYPDLIVKAMQLTGVTDINKVVKVGDTPSDLKQGHNAGCARIVGVTEGTHTQAQLEPHPHTDLIPSVADLPALLAGSQVAA